MRVLSILLYFCFVFRFSALRYRPLNVVKKNGTGSNSIISIVQNTKDTIRTVVTALVGISATLLLYNVAPAIAFGSSLSAEAGIVGEQSTQNFPIMCTEDVMCPKAHGTSDSPVQSTLRWNCDVKLADQICNFNRRFAEPVGYWATRSTFLQDTDILNIDISTTAPSAMQKQQKPIEFFDSVTGRRLFVAPVGRSFEEWKQESLMHGWPSFRDSEVRGFELGKNVIILHAANCDRYVDD